MTETILVVDDDPGMRLTIREILEEEGYRVVVAGDGLDGLSALDGERPALIVLDISMPHMDGYAFAAELERRGLRPAIPVMVLTADGRASEKAVRVGADGCLGKPFDLDELVVAVGRLLRSKPG